MSARDSRCLPFLVAAAGCPTPAGPGARGDPCAPHGPGRPGGSRAGGGFASAPRPGDRALLWRVGRPGGCCRGAPDHRARRPDVTAVARRCSGRRAGVPGVTGRRGAAGVWPLGTPPRGDGLGGLRGIGSDAELWCVLLPSPSASICVFIYLCSFLNEGGFLQSC